MLPEQINPYLRRMEQIPISLPMPDESLIGQEFVGVGGNVWRLEGFMLNATHFEERGRAYWLPKYLLVTTGRKLPRIFFPETEVKTDATYYYLGDPACPYQVIGFDYNPLAQSKDKQWSVVYVQQYDGAYPEGTIWHRRVSDFEGTTRGGRVKFMAAMGK